MGRSRAGLRRWVAIAGLACLVSGCSCGEDEPPAKPTGGSGSTGGGAAGAEAEPTGAKSIDPATAGSVAGRITVAGTPPARGVLPTVGEQFCMETHSARGGVPDERLLVQDGKLQGAFVWVKRGLEAYAFDAHGLPDVVLDQRGCVYSPHVVGAQVGQRVLAATSDPVLHNVHTHPQVNRPQNIAMPGGSQPKELNFRKPEVMVRVACDVHAWMTSWVGIVEHPYFTVTGPDGGYRFEGLPPGTYTLGVWHETLGEKEFELQLPERGEVTAPDIVYSL